MLTVQEYERLMANMDTNENKNTMASPLKQTSKQHLQLSSR